LYSTGRGNAISTNIFNFTSVVSVTGGQGMRVESRELAVGYGWDLEVGIGWMGG
jgi:hypothetical protein